MRVRVKKDQKGFIYGSLRNEEAEFNLKPVTHPRKLDGKGKPLVISIKDQFSKVWMEAVDKPKKPKKVEKEETTKDSQTDSE